MKHATCCTKFAALVRYITKHLFHEYLHPIGLFQKISTAPPMNGVPKRFRISKKCNGSLCKIPYPANSKSWGILEFRKNLNGIPGIPAKLTKFWEYSSTHVRLSINYRISNVVHGGMRIFSGIAQYILNLKILSQSLSNFTELLTFGS